MTRPSQPAVPVGIQSPLDERLRALALLFLKLGTISFGGPAAHIALMEDEVVRKRRWLTRQQYLDMLGLTNLIPGPNSTEMAINVGFVRAGWPGLVVAGASFIVPAALITATVAWAYVRFGTVPLAESLLAGVKPAVIAVISIAVWRLGRIAVHDVWLAVLGVAALAAFLGKLSPLLILTGGGAIGMVVQRMNHQRRRTPSDSSKLSAGLILLKKSFLLPSLLPGAMVAAVGLPVTKSVPLARLGWFFLKVGAVLYGGGYVLFAFVDQGLVRDLHWLTQQQVLDAIAIGQFTPGPVLSTATFIGYLLGGAERRGRCDCSDFSAVVFLRGSAGADFAQASPIRVGGGISRFRERVCGSADGRRDGEAVGRCLARMADVGHRASGAGGVVEMED